jgi:hypothetical protein
MMPGSGGALMYKSLKTDRQLQKIPDYHAVGRGAPVLSALSENAQHQTGGSRCPILTTIWKNRPMPSSC